MCLCLFVLYVLTHTCSRPAMLVVIIGASLREPHTSKLAVHNCLSVCVSVYVVRSGTWSNSLFMSSIWAVTKTWTGLGLDSDWTEISGFESHRDTSFFSPLGV